ncbi:hypothetical protein KBC55_03565 [Patescibacteria group bacterium]|nr:hypothetical protein [Patescibacteria group bacterium]
MKKLAVAALFSIGFLLPGISLAQLSPGDNYGLNDTAQAGYGEGVTSNSNIGTYLGTYIIQPVLGLMGILFLLLTVYAGFLWMTAQGDDSKVKKAKDILVAAVIGAVIMASAYVLTAAVFNALSTGSITAAATTSTQE